MESKYTRAQIEEKLDTVFDSVLQTKDVEVTGDMEITPDDGFLGLKKVNVTAKGGGGENTLEPNGWCWKVSDALLADTNSKNYSKLNQYFVMIGRVFDGVYNLLSLTKREEDKIIYRMIGDLNGSSDIRIVAIRESTGAKLSMGSTTIEGISICDVYQKIQGGTEADFITMMEGEGFIRITNEEYEALISE